MIDPLRSVILLGIVDSEVKGLIFGICEDLYFSDTKAATELIWHCDIGARGMGLGGRLATAFGIWASAVKAKFISFTNTVGTTELHDVYLRKGFRPVETTYIKEI